MTIEEGKIRNKNIKGCIICQNEDLSRRIDPILFKAEMPLKTLKETLENDLIFIPISELGQHARHIFYDKKEITTEDELKGMEGKTNIDLTKSMIARVQKHIKTLENEGKSNTAEHQKLIKEMAGLIELKSKLEGDLKPSEVIIGLPDWVKRAAEECEEDKKPEQ